MPNHYHDRHAAAVLSDDYDKPKPIPPMKKHRCPGCGKKRSTGQFMLNPHEFGKPGNKRVATCYKCRGGL